MGSRIPKRVLKICIIFIFCWILDIFGIYTYLFQVNYARHYSLDSWVLGIRKNHSSYEYNNNIPKCNNLSDTQVVLVIKSAIPNSELRAVIRHTWGSENRHPGLTLKRVFVIGSTADYDAMHAIEEESRQNHDIVQATFIDNYFNNTLKTMMGMKWALKYCSNGLHFLFVDDDYYVSVKNVVKFISQEDSNGNDTKKSRASKLDSSQLNQRKQVFAGYAIQSAPLRHRLSKWFIPFQEYPYTLWPPYVTAGAFLLSRNTLSDLFYISQYTDLFRFDDVFLGMAALKARIKLTHCNLFYFYKPKYSGPQSYRDVIASHGFDDPFETEKVWTESFLAGYA